MKRVDGFMLARGLWCLICGFMVVLWGQDFLAVTSYPEKYPFGVEGPVAGIWFYASERLYRLHLALLLLWFSVGILMCLGRASFRRWKLLPAHIGLTALWFIAARLGFPV